MVKVSPLEGSTDYVECWINLTQIQYLRTIVHIDGEFSYKVVLSGYDLKLSEEDYNRIKKELALP